ncbi:putative sortase family protein [Actinoplanes friuliensis DSM 7358]|uniref:Putative sortase family protein n=1 Tax=Actinoplanes friuliensis DSM 7358 TaxID=1246995 RepID=U5W090_9ACTN|nr:putative sortase family protein [Actinoplanes friuliensis DSM 7358]
MNKTGASFRGRALLLVIAGLVLLIGAGIAWVRTRPEPSVGTAAVVALASAPAPSSSSSSSSSSSPSSARPSPSRKAAGEVVPARLRIPAMKLDATVAAVGVDAKTGDFAVPPSVDRVGWYRFGPGMTADAGSIVVAGHVDSAAQGKGAFFGLDKLSPGDPISLADADGVIREFEVIARERYAKTRIPLDRYFARDGATRLTLITCGGPFDKKTGHYRDNIVVTAQPVG